MKERKQHFTALTVTVAAAKQRMTASLMAVWMANQYQQAAALAMLLSLYFTSRRETLRLALNLKVQHVECRTAVQYSAVPHGIKSAL